MGKLVLITFLIWAFSVIAPAIIKAENDGNTWKIVPNLPEAKYPYQKEINTFKGEIYYYVFALYPNGKIIKLYVGVYKMDNMLYTWNSDFFKFRWDSNNLIRIKKR